MKLQDCCIGDLSSLTYHPVGFQEMAVTISVPPRHMSRSLFFCNCYKNAGTFSYNDIILISIIMPQMSIVQGCLIYARDCFGNFRLDICIMDQTLRIKNRLTKLKVTLTEQVLTKILENLMCNLNKKMYRT